ncbi:MAG: LysR family transcriptional regulator [Lachnospiraceae bacterium]|nr:LysR family transcriptional regulator [Lachnospiraceae bacterium]
MDFDFRRIQYFVSVANNLSFTAAAREMYMSAQGLNKQIMKLETELGCQLFERTTRKVKLTEEGEKLYDIFDQVVRDYVRGCKDFENFRDTRHHVMKIGYFSGLSREKIIAPIVQYLRGFKRDIIINLQIGEMEQIKEWLSDGVIDMAITNVHAMERWMMNFEMIEIKNQPGYIVTSMCHPLIEKTKVDAKDLAKYPMLISRHLSDMPADSFYKNIKAKEKIYMENFNSLIINLETGPYFAVIPKGFDGNENLKLKYYDLPDKMKLNFSTVIMYDANGKFGKALEDIGDIAEEMDF